MKLTLIVIPHVDISEESNLDLALVLPQLSLGLQAGTHQVPLVGQGLPTHTITNQGFRERNNKKEKDREMGRDLSREMYILVHKIEPSICMK